MVDAQLQLHLKLIDWPKLVLGAEPIYEPGPMYKSYAYFLYID